ncbi:hypothetical protein AX16_003886 [Volvariella volvacea WC 439]|nr:hypothetical protein AX16_003886 [Volvariella volvacea WC 439]
MLASLATSKPVSHLLAFSMGIMPSPFGADVPLAVKILSSVITLALVVALVHPITNVIVRFRADYSPKPVYLQSEDGAVLPLPTVGVHSVFGMIRRIWLIEGIGGFYKGYLPTAISAIVVFLVSVAVLGIDAIELSYNEWPRLSAPESITACFILTVLALPITVVTFRAITTPYVLPYFNVLKSCRLLFTPTERRRPWSIYLIPGLLITSLARNATYLLILAPLRRLLLPPFDTSDPQVAADKLTLFIALVALATVITTPLEVVETRLAIQQYHADLTDASQTHRDEEGLVDDVISYRRGDDPYIGLLDATDRITHEEGRYILFRAWWFTFLAGLSLVAA